MSVTAELAAVFSERFAPVTGYLDTATSGIPPLAAAEVTERAVHAWRDGRLDGKGFDAPVDAARASFARLVGVEPQDVAIGAAASAFAGIVAASLPSGAHVVTAEGDFTSVLFPFLAQAGRGIEVREVALERIPEAIDAHTSLVAVSVVQSADGRIVDLDALAAAASHHGADVFLDATQAAGWLPFDASRFAYVTASAYKWLLAPRGTAFFTVRPELRDTLTPHQAGWYSAEDPWGSCYGGPLRLAAGAKRFDLAPAWICWAGAAPALALIEELGVEAFHAHDVALARHLRSGLGLEASDSAILTVDRPGAAERLAAAGVRASVRAGRVRLSCHVPATIADTDRALEALS